MHGSGGEAVRTKVLLATLICLGLSFEASAVERLVPDEYAHIQDAIDAALKGDVVVIKPGTYQGTIDFNDKAITVRSMHPDSWEDVKSTVIRGGSGSCVVFVKGEGPDSVLEGLTLQDGWGVGAGVYCENSSPTIRRCNISNNTGSGIAVVGTCRALITGCLITNNDAARTGSGVVIWRLKSPQPPDKGPVGTGPKKRSLRQASNEPLAEAPLAQGDSMIVNCTIADNSTERSDAYEVDCRDTRPQIINTIIYGQMRSLLIQDPCLVSHCCIKDVWVSATDPNVSPVLFDITAGTGNISKAPGNARQLYDSSYHLLPGSPCIDAGDRTVVFGEGMDIDGQARVMGRTVDIGADEMAPQLVVTKPSAGEFWVGGSVQEIQWNTVVFHGEVDILLSLDGGNNWQPVADANAEAGRLAWHLPQMVDSNRCVVLVRPSVPDPNAVVTPSAVFTIHAPVEYVVSDEKAGGVQAAIDAAQKGDTVILKPGSYQGPIYFRGKAITVRSMRPDSWETINNTVISTGRKDSCVFFTQGEGPDTVLEGLTLREGAGIGAGVYCVGSSPTIRRCNICNNNGSGIAIIGNCGVLITSCLVTNNYGAITGSGIRICRELEGTTGGTTSRSRTPSPPNPETPSAQRESTIINCTIADNFGGGSDYEVDCRDTRPRIINTIICGEDRSLLIPDPRLVSHCCAKDVWVSTAYSATAFDITTVASNISKVPGLALWELYDSSYHLLPGSPCIDTGDRAAVLGERMDIDGQARVMSKTVDIGADEMPPQLLVTKPSGGDVWVGGSAREIEWSAAAFHGKMHILLSQDGGNNWQPVADANAEAGSLTWEVPQAVDSSQCMMLARPAIPDPNALMTPSAVFRIHPDSMGPEVESAWASLGGDYDRSGLSDYAGLGLGCLKWKFETDGPIVGSVTSSFDDRLHVACEDGKLHTLDANGTELWVWQAKTPLLSSPSVGPDGSLYVGGADGRLYVVDPNGRLRWTCKTDGPIYSSPAVGPSGDVYVGSSDGSLHALASDGSEQWRFTTKGPGVARGSVLASPAIGRDGSVYVSGLYEPNLYALEPHDGSVKWVCNFEMPADPCQPKLGNKSGWLFASPVVAKDGTIYQAILYDSCLYAVDPANGSIIWSADLRGATSDPNGWSEPVLGPDGTIYVSLEDGYLRAVDPSGRIKWVSRHKVGDGGTCTLAVAADGYVRAACSDGSIRIIDPDGYEVEEIVVGGWPAFPIVLSDRTLVVSDSQDYSMLITDAKNAVWAITKKCPDSAVQAAGAGD
jgi:outer membrane protein assembly factor BamB